MAGLEDGFNAPHPLPSPVTPPCPSPSLSHCDYVTHNLGLRHSLESGAYIFSEQRAYPCTLLISMSLACQIASERGGAVLRYLVQHTALRMQSRAEIQTSYCVQDDGVLCMWPV